MKYIILMRRIKQVWQRCLQALEDMDRSPVEDLYQELVTLRREVELLRAERPRPAELSQRRVA